MKRKTMFDDGYQEHLVEGAEFYGEEGIPGLLDLDNTEVPASLIAFPKARTANNKSGYVHFYVHDICFRQIFSATDKYIDVLKQFHGVITPDPTIVIGKSKCLHATSVYMSRAVGYYLQKQGIPVIPNVRWGDETSYSFAFLGIPKHSIVCVSTHGVLRKDSSNGNIVRECFIKGLPVMLEKLEPRIVLVYGRMPDEIFGPYLDNYKFVRYPSDFEMSRKKGENCNGINL